MGFRVGDIVVGHHYEREVPKVWKWLVLDFPVKHFPIPGRLDIFFHTFEAYNITKRRKESVSYSEATIQDFEVMGSI